jgi:hypothetical protein
LRAIKNRPSNFDRILESFPFRLNGNPLYGESKSPAASHLRCAIVGGGPDGARWNERPQEEFKRRITTQRPNSGDVVLGLARHRARSTCARLTVGRSRTSKLINQPIDVAA